MMSTARTLSQWHTRTTSGWISMVRWSALMGTTLHLSPRGGRALVFQHDAAVEKLLADAVSFGEVLIHSRRMACRDALGNPLLAHARRRCLQECLRLAREQSQHAAERLELAGRLAVTLEHGIGELVQLGDGLRRAEVVVHGIFEARSMPLVPVDSGTFAG